ncbi:phosphoribosylanthranilate isomerase [Chitinophaga costaii]|uniref:N-(5'-phosphoribosyl)anthranilate isomerase n=1 Tax=Chitinophaga costaii TaxID=1335309 RepID=A0A1C3ZK40_9BACT|nr:phosphoribosylanthranilate isomerase [Chitinophaga costaii]PUZ30410.1 phosphoribosylanthranilate isomerase [Chitinophaga costaii]SCB82797.1 phosphoribosylanthranilate isomerase [Chitinophaga costaii]
MKIKVCGITRLEDLETLSRLGVEYAGLIFYERSPRYMGHQLAAADVKKTAPHLAKVGVFVNETLESVLDRVTGYGLQLVQLHGDETPEYCATLAQYVPVIKAFRIADTVSWDIMKPYTKVVDYFLFDTASKAGYGGTGHQFNWTVLDDYPFEVPFFLSGGIGASAVGALKSLRWPRLYAVDVNSRFETSPGIKDLNAVQAFITALSSTQNH